MMPLQPNNAAPRTFSAAYGNRRQRSLISLTPLIDVVFILLLFFMLASSFLDLNSIVLDAPAQGAGTPSIQGALLIEVRVDGVRFAGRYISLDDLAARVRRQLSEHPERRILIQPGAGVTLQRTVGVLDRLSSVGATHMSLMRSPGAGRLGNAD